jgi:hypothetical protein
MTMTVTEPSGEDATANLTIALVAGVGVAAGTYADDAGTGAVTGVGTFLPEPPSDCILGASQFQANMLLAAVHA